MKKMLLTTIAIVLSSVLANQLFAMIIITNLTPLQYNFNFNNGFMCGISATSPATNYFTGPGTEPGDFMGVGGIDYSMVKVDPGLSPHTPLGAPMDVLSVGWTLSGFPTTATSVGWYGGMFAPFNISYTVAGPNIMITMY